ncbi:MAG: PTS system mannose/fructose/N-acetylgalactosamine-transporter subunit IIB, partial [Myxococcales bacterium]
MISLVRIDNRLIHGQVVQAWVPFLCAERILVVDDQAATNPLVRACMELCVPPDVKVDVAAVEATDFQKLSADKEKLLVLVRDVADVVRAREHGLPVSSVNLGNVHFADGRAQVSPSVFLSPEEVRELERLASDGVQIEVRALPKDRPLGMDEIASKV